LIQERLLPERERGPIPDTTWGGPRYDAVKEVDGEEHQRVELSRGCPHNCDFCYAPTEAEVFSIPEIRRRYVEILDMNILWPRGEMLDLLTDLPEQLDGERVRYEAICGFDRRLLDQDTAELIRRKNFVKPRIAWDGPFNEQLGVKDTIDLLKEQGYRARDIGVFVIVNYKTSFQECLKKLDLLKVWGVRVCDCCFDGGYRNAVPEYWSAEEIKEFRRRSRKHNQLINFGIDPELDVPDEKQTKIVEEASG